MARLLRDEARAQTRARLLAAAQKIFAEKGFGAGLEEIADAAGYSRGAVYYNFADKDELFVAVLEERTRQQISEISRLLEASNSPSDFFQSLRVRGEQHRQSRDDRRWGLLSAEFWLYALRNPKAQHKLADHHRRLRAAYASATVSVFARLGIDPPAPVERVAALIFALDEGVFHQHWIDPRAVPAEVFYDTLELLISAAVALHEIQGVNLGAGAGAGAGGRSGDGLVRS
ncbi:MAG TPA: TetR family transcriptional regulator [Acidimicrobiales bacterium]|nr:TetR family transcriptional regulator [Acidimicrobiales bacterium]